MGSILFAQGTTSFCAAELAIFPVRSWFSVEIDRNPRFIHRCDKTAPFAGTFYIKVQIG